MSQSSLIISLPLEFRKDYLELLDLSPHLKDFIGDKKLKCINFVVDSTFLYKIRQKCNIIDFEIKNNQVEVKDDKGNFKNFLLYFGLVYCFYNFSKYQTDNSVEKLNWHFMKDDLSFNFLNDDIVTIFIQNYTGNKRVSFCHSILKKIYNKYRIWIFGIQVIHSCNLQYLKYYSEFIFLCLATKKDAF